MNPVIPNSRDYFEQLIPKNSEVTQAPNGVRSAFDYLKDRQFKIALAVSGASIAATVGLQPFDETKHQLIEAAPWVGAGLVAGEALWIGGAAMMATSVGVGIKGDRGNKSSDKNPDLQNSTPLSVPVDYFHKITRPEEYPDLNREELKYLKSLKDQVPTIARHANNSKLFKSGFWINTTGAVGQFGVIAAGVGLETPPSAWGLVSIGVVDLAATIAIRKAILDGIRDNSSKTD